MNKEAQQAIETMDQESLICRDFSHSWGGWYARRDGSGFERGIRCSVCGTCRIEKLDSQGRIVSRRYEYPDGYLLKGVGRITADFRAMVRLTVLARTATYEIDSGHLTMP